MVAKCQRNVNRILSAYQARIIKKTKLIDLLVAYETAMKLEIEGQSIYPIFVANELEIGNILIDDYCLKNNPSFAAAKDLLMWKFCQRYQARSRN